MRQGDRYLISYKDASVKLCMSVCKEDESSCISAFTDTERRIIISSHPILAGFL